MATHCWKYDVHFGGRLVEEYREDDPSGQHDILSALGKALVAFSNLKMEGYCEVWRVYCGDAYDPVLHGPHREAAGMAPSIVPPCPGGCVDGCPWRKSKREAFMATCRPTALRTEVMPPEDRCGYLLDPGRLGGAFFDYQRCWPAMYRRYQTAEGQS